MSFVLIRYVLMAAMRDKLVWSMLSIAVLGICLSIFSGSAAILEQPQFVLTYMAGGLRIICLMGLTLFTVFFVRRSFDAREIEFLLTRPLSRLSFVLSYATAFTILSVITGVLLALLVGGASAHYGNFQGIALWSFGVTFEFILVTCVAFFFSMVLSNPVSSGLTTFGFYMLTRLMGQVLSIVHHQTTADTFDYVMFGLGKLMSVISVVIPRLDLMTQTTWLLYGGGDVSDWLFIVAQSAVFLGLILTATYIDLKKRQF